MSYNIEVRIFRRSESLNLWIIECSRKLYSINRILEIIYSDFKQYIKITYTRSAAYSVNIFERFASEANASRFPLGGIAISFLAFEYCSGIRFLWI
ncbi:hypothetical protein V1478_012543 [Vespula squamosa]|uniref:Uncharacterized protein n=1 Tax=Vespula squamosa TaxID=30214 RepID=A0ABD2ADH0_VESSQ